MGIFNRNKEPLSTAEGIMTKALINGGDYTVTTTADTPRRQTIEMDDMTKNMLAFGGGDMPPHAARALAGKTL